MRDRKTDQETLKMRGNDYLVIMATALCRSMEMKLIKAHILTSD